MLPKRKHIRLPRSAYQNPPSAFALTIAAFERRSYFDVSEFNGQIIALLRALALKHGCPVKLFCLMPTHLHLLAKPGKGSLLDLIGEFKKKSADLARKTRGIQQLWQRRFFDHRLRAEESVSRQCEYIRMNPLRAGLVAHPEEWEWTGSIEIPGITW